MTSQIRSLSLSTICQILLLTLSISIKSLANSPEKKTSAFFIFGDSTVDVGNNNYIDTLVMSKANMPPYGQNFFNKPTGRFSNGRLVVDFIAEYAELPLIPPSKQPSSKFINGANFASGGAGVLPETYQGFVIDFPTQLEQFNSVVSLLTAELGDAEARELIANAVYFISIGSNDYLYYLGSPKVQEIFTPEDIIAMVIGNLSEAIQGLYEKGARKFGFLSTSPLGCLPAIRAANRKADGSCFEDFSALALAHNNALYGVLLSFEHILKDFKYAFSSGHYSWLHEVIHNPTKFGFKDGINACCGTGLYGGIYSCGGNKEVAEYELCNSPDDFVFWDSFHGTEKLAKKLADKLWEDQPNSVGPYNLKELFFNQEKSRIEDIVEAKENLEAFAM
ncbi:GDSL esterase/lipase 5-like [Phalaenopsis equestris]|uniref:GDSL esterase/lipase 5-like n=1 Tax=Phalaenopsis equestris TaxID=78828 RepID=UPI0009E4FCFD|nr:GDSL esterase/lipase 5-like [Phalaenopsis equestris]